jgi:hypothetical protein
VQFQDFKCQDPRDKTFGLHSLAQTCCRQCRMEKEDLIAELRGGRDKALIYSDNG